MVAVFSSKFVRVIVIRFRKEIAPDRHDEESFFPRIHESNRSVQLDKIESAQMRHSSTNFDSYFSNMSNQALIACLILLQFD